MRHYHATECILDLIAASGPQDHYSINRECSTQCTSPEFDETLPIGEHMIAVGKALTVLESAGLIECEDGGAWDFTPYGYVILSTYATPAFKANAANRVR